MGAPVVHFEIGCKDKAATADFYTSIFGWTTQEFGPATMINTAADSGIHGHFNALGHEPHHYTIFYIQVDDVDAYLKKVGSRGGKTLVPQTEVPGAGWFAWFADPAGNTVGLWKPAPQPG